MQSRCGIQNIVKFIFNYWWCWFCFLDICSNKSSRCRVFATRDRGPWIRFLSTKIVGWSKWGMMQRVACSHWIRLFCPKRKECLVSVGFMIPTVILQSWAAIHHMVTCPCYQTKYKIVLKMVMSTSSASGSVFCYREMTSFTSDIL